jgi:hypothetical protein
MPPKTLTAEQVAEIDRQQQQPRPRPVNWQSVIPQKEDVLTARVNRAAARQDAPVTLTAEQVDTAEAQNSVAAETSFGRAMGARPDRSVGPQVPAPKKVLSAAEVDQADYERVGNISYLPTKDEWKRYGQLRQRRDSNVGKFLEAGQAIAGGLFQAVAATAYAPFDFVARGTNAYDEWVNSSAEGMRQASISTAELWSWAGDVYDDNQRELQRNRSLNDQVRQRLALENRFTGNPQQDDAILKESISQAKAQGLYEKTPNDLSEDEDTQYQRFIRDRSFQQQAANVTETNIGTLPDDRAEMGIDESKLNEGLVLGSAMVLDPLNVVVPAGLGAANKVRLLRRVGSLAGTPLKGASKVAGYMAGKAEAGYGRIVEGIESATGLTGSQQMSALSNVSFKAAAAMAALKKSGAVLRATERGLRTGSILAREIGIGGVGASRVEAASKLRSAPIPERYRRAYDGFFTSADSTLRRVSETQGLSPIARRSAATLDRFGATQVFRAADDAVSGAAATAPIAVPLAAIAPEERRPEILGSILTIGAGAGLISGKPSRAADFDDALVAKMLADAEISGGDATSMANMIPHDRLVNMARGQSVISSKADFIPLRATDYELNATVKEAMGLGTRGIYVDAKKGERPRIFVNLDKMASGDVAGHEIGHAIFKSDILGGEIKRGMRAMTDQQYGTDGVAARGREYVAAMLTQEVRDGATGIQLNVLKPDEVTRIAQARGDEAAERALTDEFVRERWANDADWRQQAIDERADMLNQESLGRGDTSWDWARDEIAAETFSGLGKGLNLSGIRASGPLSRAVGAASAAFEAMGARMRGNGRLETPNRLFVENPLFDTPEMRKAVNDYVKTFDRYLVGLEKEGAVKQRGTPIAPTGKAQDAARSPHTRTYSNRDGTVIESDLFIERPDGTRVPKSQQQLDTQEKVRAATIKSINDRTKFVNENSDEWGARKLSNGRVEVGGPNLPLQFDHFIQVPEWLRAKAREFEAGRSKGRSYLYSYNAIGTGEAGSYKIKNLGNVEAKTGEMVPFGWAVSTKNHLLAKVIDLNSFRAAAIRAIDNEQLGEFGNDLRAVESGLKQLLSNYENGVAGETGLGVTRKNLLNGLLGTGTVVQKASNPVWHTLNNQGSVRTFRFDRLNYADPHGTGYFPHYNKININALPDDAGRMSLDQYGQFDADRKAAWMNREAVKRGFSNATNWQNADAQGFQAADGQYRQQFPAGGAAQRGSAMPDARANTYADQADAVDLGGAMVTPTARNIRIRALALPDAYHGTPHDVDSFSMEKIGTGEGAQAYGHGLYFAEHQDVAKGYMPRDRKQDASMYAEYSRAEKTLDYDSMSFWEDAMLYRSRQELAEGHGEALGGRLESKLKRWDAIQEASGGNMYKVRIKADDAELLDWDKPLSEQSKAVQRAAKKFLDQARRSFPATSDNLTGGGLYTTYADHRGGNMETASAAFLDAGIKGVRYLDGNSRAQGRGTVNYVVFDESLIEITERNGKPVSLKTAAKESKRTRGQALPDTDGSQQTGYDNTYLKQALAQGSGGMVKLTRPIGPNEALPLLSQVPQITQRASSGSFAFDRPALVEFYTNQGQPVAFKWDPDVLVRPQFKDVATEHAGKPIQLAMADRQQAVGGDMGGVMHTYLKSLRAVSIKDPLTGRKLIPVWANNEWKPAKAMKGKAARGAKDLLVYLMGETAHGSNLRTVRRISNEIDNAPLSAKEKDVFLIIANKGVKQARAREYEAAIKSATAKAEKLKERLKSADDKDKASINKQLSRVTRSFNDAKTKLPKYKISLEEEEFAAVVTNYRNAGTRYKNGTGSLEAFQMREEEFFKYLDGFKRVKVEEKQPNGKTREVYKYIPSGAFKKLESSVHGKHLIKLDNTFDGRKAAVAALLGLNIKGFNVDHVLPDTADFQGGRINHIVSSVELSTNPDLGAVYLGNDPQQAKFMTPLEAAEAKKIKASNKYVVHEAYSWVMLGPEDGNHFLNSNPKTNEDYFPWFRQRFADTKADPVKRDNILTASDTSLINTMRDQTLFPLVMPAK